MERLDLCPGVFTIADCKIRGVHDEARSVI